MARDFKRKNKLAVISDLNVTPLIDLAFSLLIIFMITTPVIEQYNRIDLPDQPSEQDQPLPEIDDEFITIDAEGTYHWGQLKVSKDELEERLDRIAASSGGRIELLRNSRLRILRAWFPRAPALTRSADPGEGACAGTSKTRGVGLTVDVLRGADLDTGVNDVPRRF